MTWKEKKGLEVGLCKWTICIRALGKWIEGLEVCGVTKGVDERIDESVL